MAGNFLGQPLNLGTAQTAARNPLNYGAIDTGNFGQYIDSFTKGAQTSEFVANRGARDQAIQDTQAANQQAQETNKFNLQSGKDLKKRTSLAEGAAGYINTPPEQRLAFLENRKQELINQGLPTEETEQAIAAHMQDPVSFEATSQSAVQTAYQTGLLKAPTNATDGSTSNMKEYKQWEAMPPGPDKDAFGRMIGASEKARTGGLASAVTKVYGNGTVVQSLPTGDVQVRNVNNELLKGKAAVDALNEAKAAELKQKQLQEDIEVDSAERKERAKIRAKREQTVRTEKKTRNNANKRESMIIKDAMYYAKNATQGLPGYLKQEVARVFPGIDVTNEASLQTALGQLAIDKLSQFKGPTTDFEFKKIQETVGRLSDSKSGNIARIKAMERINWANQMDYKQYNKHIKDGGNPDDYSFDITEPILVGNKAIPMESIIHTARENNLSMEEAINKLNKLYKD